MNKSDFIQEVVFGWMKGDLSRMLENRPLPDKKGNLNFPIVLCTLSYMEYLGGVLLGTDKTFIGNVSEYIRNCFENPEEYPTKILNDFIRNGLAHDYFPRGAISRNGKHPTIYKGITYELVLDAETLAIDFIKSLDTFDKILLEENYENRMSQIIEKINKFKKDNSEYLKGLRGQPDDEKNYGPSPGYEWSKNSGPSGYNGPINTTT